MSSLTIRIAHKGVLKHLKTLEGFRGLVPGLLLGGLKSAPGPQVTSGPLSTYHGCAIAILIPFRRRFLYKDIGKHSIFSLKYLNFSYSK